MQLHILVGFACRQSKIQKRQTKWVVSFPHSLSPSLGLAGGRGAQPAKSPRIGFLSAVSPSTISARVEAFRQGLRELGYHEGANNIVIEWRFADGKLDRLPALAAELARLKVDVIVSSRSNGNPPRQGSQTSSIPIVMAVDDKTLWASGFVASLAQPGANITGLSALSPGNKRKTTRAAQGDPTETRSCGGHRVIRPEQGNGHNVGRDGTRRKGSQGAASIPRRARVQIILRLHFEPRAKVVLSAVLVLRSPAFPCSANADCRNRGKEPASRQYIAWPEYVEGGGLISYGVNILDLSAALRPTSTRF